MRLWFLAFLILLASVGLLASCTGTSRGISPDPKQMHYPIGIAIHPSGKYLYVVNANFDLAFTGGSVMVFNTTEERDETFDIQGVQTQLKTLSLVENATVEIGSFSGQIVVNNQGTRAYVAVRQDRKSDSALDSSSITTLNIDVSKSGKGHLSCSETAISNEQTGGVGVEDKYEVPAAPKCGDASKVFFDDNPFPYSLTLLHKCSAKRSCKADADCTCSEADKKAGLCSADQVCGSGACVAPCATDADCSAQSSCQSGKCIRKTGSSDACQSDADCISSETCKDENRLLVSHLQQGGLSELTVQANSLKHDRRIAGFSTLPAGVTSLAVLTTPSALGNAGEIFLTSRQDNNLYLLPTLLPTGTDLQKIPVSHTTTTTSTLSADLRGLVIGADLKNRRVRLYVAVRRPSAAVLVYHLERIEGKLVPTLINSIPVGADPAHIVYRQRPAPEPDLLYVVCSRAGRIDVIDVESLQPLYQIRVGAQPYFMAFYEPKPGAEITHRRLYVANFLDSTISIINLDNHKVVGMVKGIDTRPPLP